MYGGLPQFNRSLRLYARKQGYSLNQRGLSRGVIRNKNGLKMTEGEHWSGLRAVSRLRVYAGEIVASKTEEEIFKILGIRWR